MIGRLVSALVLSCFALGESYAVDWPLRISASGKYLEDQAGVPFLITADAAWEVTTQISDADAITYLDNRVAKGFNAVEIRIIGHAFQTRAPNDYYNNAPFTNGPNDWSVRNEAYWARMDTILTAIRSRNMVALVFPAYLGYGCGDEGWCQQMLVQTNSAMTSYGQWIGNRYKDYGNIIWMTGGDTDCVNYTNACARNNAVVSGIRTTDTDALFSAEPVRGQIAGIDAYVSVVDINATYVRGADEGMAQRAYNSFSPFMLNEGYYENEHSTSLNTWDGQAMITYLGGGLIGHVFGTCPLWSFGAASYFCDSSSSPFNTWQSSMNSQGSIHQGNLGRLMRSRKWWTFVPDNANTVVISSKGSGESYHATARETIGETVMVWCPDTNTVTVDMTKIGGTQAKAWWWNPDDNTSILIGTYSTTGARNFNPSSARKVLVLDNAAHALAQPGTTDYFLNNNTLTPPTNLRIVY